LLSNYTVGPGDSQHTFVSLVFRRRDRNNRILACSRDVHLHNAPHRCHPDTELVVDFMYSCSEETAWPNVCRHWKTKTIFDSRVTVILLEKRQLRFRINFDITSAMYRDTCQEYRLKPLRNQRVFSYFSPISLGTKVFPEDYSPHESFRV